MHAAEILFIVMFLAQHLPTLSGLKFTLVVGHSKLVKATCLGLGITDAGMRKRVFDVLYYISTSNSKSEFIAQDK